MLYLSSEISWIAPLNILSFDITSLGGPVCLGPLSDGQRLLLGLIVPGICVLQLLFTCLVSFLLLTIRRKGHCNNQCAERWMPHDEFQPAKYFRTIVAVIIFAYVVMCRTILSFYDCIPVGEESVVSTYPAMSCNGDEYKMLAPLFYVLTAVIVCGFPLIVLSVLLYQYANGSLTQAAQQREADAQKKNAFPAIINMKMKFLSDVYGSHALFYEVILFIRRITTIVLLVFYTSDRPRKLLALSIFNVAYLLMHFSLKPHLDKFDNLQETFGLTVHTVITVILLTAAEPLNGIISSICGILIWATVLLFVIRILYNRFRLPDTQRETDIALFGTLFGARRRSTVTRGGSMTFEPESPSPGRSPDSPSPLESPSPNSPHSPTSPQAFPVTDQPNESHRSHLHHRNSSLQLVGVETGNVLGDAIEDTPLNFDLGLTTQISMPQDSVVVTTTTTSDIVLQPTPPPLLMQPSPPSSDNNTSSSSSTISFLPAPPLQPSPPSL
jgi:hypothetical protein